MMPSVLFVLSSPSWWMTGRISLFLADRRTEDPLMADERSAPNRGWIRNHLMHCIAACTHCHWLHHHHHNHNYCHHQQSRASSLLWPSWKVRNYDRVGVTLECRECIIGAPPWLACQLQRDGGQIPYLSQVHLRGPHVLCKNRSISFSILFWPPLFIP